MRVPGFPQGETGITFWRFLYALCIAMCFFGAQAFFVPEVLAQRLPQGSLCPVIAGKPYRSPSDATVYLVTPECTKRPFFNPAVYFSFFEDWNEVIFLEDEEMDGIKKDPLNFLPWGPRRIFEDGSLVKITSDPRVYLIMNREAYPIDSEEAFKALGYGFDQIEDVAEVVLNAFTKRPDRIIRGLDDIPELLVFKYPDDPRVYRLVKKEDGTLEKQYVSSMEELEGYIRPDRIAVLPIEKIFSGAEGPAPVPEPVPPTAPPQETPAPVTPPSSGGGGGGGGGGSSTPAPVSDTTAPVISAVASSTTASSAVITWTTNESSTSIVEHGETASYGSTSSSALSVTSHSIGLTDLESDTVYHFRVRSQDASGNAVTSVDYTFRTDVLDETAPVITLVASSTSVTTATITWTTDEVATSTVEYGIDDSYGSTSSSSSLVTSHAIGLVGLVSNTLYHFRVSSQDASGNQASSTDYTFRTEVAPDTDAPLITLVASSTSVTTATITWTTNESATSTVEYGTTDSYGSTTSSVALETSHSIALSSLASNTVYHFRVSSQDASGNHASSTDYTFRTTVVADTDAPVITAIATSTDGGTGATITWTTNESATSTVEYGLTTDYGSSSSSVALETSHSITLSGLTPNTTYHFRVSSQDASGNVATSTDYTFIIDELIFTASTTAFTAYLNVNSGATVLWTYDDGTTSSAVTTTKSFASGGMHTIRLRVTPWSALRGINTGYDQGDGGSSLINLLAAQDVYSVSGLENVAPYLEKWASSNNTHLTSLDFSNFVNLTHIECYYCTGLASVDLSNTPSLTRACFENNNLAALDLSESPALEDLRGAQNAYTSITWGDIGAHIWHICIRDNPQFTEALPDMAQFPVLSELFIWNDNQSGALHTSSSALTAVLASGNSYTSADVSNGYPAGRNGRVDLSYNDLTSFTFDNNPGLMTINLSHNELSQVAIDGILTTLNAYETSNGEIDLSSNSPPSSVGLLAANALIARGWDVTVDGGTDYTAPVITSVASSTTMTTAIITWTTNEVATSTVEYGETDGYGSTSSSNSLTTSHSITLTGLTLGTTYHFRVSSQDESYNVATSTDYTFTTLVTPDVAGPTFSSVASSTSANTATITWTTNEAATSTVEYGETDSYGSTSSSSILVTSHSITLTGLTSDTVYHFRVSSQDASGNVSTSTDYTFETISIYWSDDFDRADGAPGNNWAGYSDATASIVSNALRRTDDGGTYYYGAYYNPTDVTLPADYYVEVTIPDSTLDTNYWGIAGRWLNDNGTRVLFQDSYTVTAGEASGWNHNNVSITVTGGFPASWSVNQNHTLGIDFSGTTATIYLDGSEYGTFTHSVNNQTGTGVAIVGEGNNRDWYDITVRPYSSISADTTAPTISSVASSTTATSATITWITNENATSTVEYGLTDGYGSTTSSLALTTSHSIVIESLTADTEYHFRMSSQDAAGNTTTTGDYTFRTTAAADTTAPTISSVASSTTATSATITWTTNENATSTVEYGTDTGYGSTTSSLALTTSHSIVIESLTADTEYHFRMSSQDAAGNTTTTGDYTFRTTASGSGDLELNAASVEWLDADSVRVTYDWTDADQLLDWTPTTGATISRSASTSTAVITGVQMQLAAMIWNQPIAVSSIIASANSGITKHVNIYSNLSSSWAGVVDWNPNPGIGHIWRSTVTGPLFIMDGTNAVSGDSLPVDNTWDVYQFESSTTTLRAWSGTGNTWREQSGSYSPTTTGYVALGAFTDTDSTSTYWGTIVIEGEVGVADITAPTISSVASSTSATSATITWTTNENATSTVQYGADIGYGSTTSSLALTTSHSIVIESLTADTEYHFRMSSQDAAGNTTTTGDYTFRTTAAADTTAPTISSVASSTTATSATITWTTNENATSTVEYGTTVGYGFSSSSVAFTTSHSITLTDLATSTVYHFRVLSQDAAGNVATSTDYTFESEASDEAIVLWQDTFDRADGDIGNGWEGYGGGTATIVSNAMRRADSDGGYGAVYNPTDVTLPADYYTEVTIPHSTLSTSYWGIAGRWASNNGVRILFENSITVTGGQASNHSTDNQTITLASGFPDSWYVDQDHTLGLNLSGSTATIYLDRQEYGHFTLSTNNQTGTGVAIVGEGNNRDWYDITVYDTPPDFVVSSVASSTSSISSVITFVTSNAATTTVEYGTTTGYGSTSSSSAYGTVHFVTLTDLTPSTLYHFRVIARDAFGLVTTSTDYTFRTAASGEAVVLWQDTFDRADGAPGNNWADYSTASGEIVSNALRRTDDSGYGVYYNPTDVLLPKDYYVSVTIPHSTLSTSYWGIAGRWVSSNGVRTLFENPTTITGGQASGFNTDNQTITVTGGFPESWLVDQNHTLTLGMAGTTSTIYLDGEEYGYFTLATNNRLYTDVAIVGEGSDRDWYDITVYNTAPDFVVSATTAPIISSVASSTSVTTSTITWVTDESATSTVQYGLTTDYGSSSSSVAFTTSHSIVLTGLATSTVYHFRVLSQDIYGNVATSTDYTFKTGSDSTTAMSTSTSIIFLHHSTGGVVWGGGVADWFTAHNAGSSTAYAITAQDFPKEFPYGWNNYPYDYWNIWVNHAGESEYQEEKTLELLTDDYDVIIWKHCFPGANISENTGSPDVTSSAKTDENYRLQYNALKAKMLEFPEKRFIVWTLAANVIANTNEAEAARARAFVEWVTDTWDEPGDNIFVWDFFELETGGGNVLLPDYAAGVGDSHPNNDPFAIMVAPIFSQRIVDVIEGRGDE